MPVFQERPRGYQIGTILLYIATALCAWGVVAPGWVQSDSAYSGIWFVCTGTGYSDCTAWDWSGADGATYVTGALSVSGLIILCLATLFSVIRNFCIPVITYRRAAPILPIWGGMKILAAAMVYVGDNNKTINAIPFLHYGPSFYLVVVGSVIAVIAGILIAVNNRPNLAGFSQFGMDPKATAAQPPQGVYAVNVIDYGYPPDQGSLAYASGQTTVTATTVTATTVTPAYAPDPYKGL